MEISSNHIKWIDHKGKQILLVDYSNKPDDMIVDATHEVNDYVKKLGLYELLILVDVRNSSATEELTVKALKYNAKTVKPYAKKVAVIGVTKTQEVILTVVNMFSDLGVNPFDTIEKAKDWLVEE